MEISQIGPRYTADVKCYHCGHISGQIVGFRGVALRPRDFRPRPGYTGGVKPGDRLRCERCAGPVFLEEAASSALADRELRAKLMKRHQDDKPKAA